MIAKMETTKLTYKHTWKGKAFFLVGWSCCLASASIIEVVVVVLLLALRLVDFESLNSIHTHIYTLSLSTTTAVSTTSSLFPFFSLSPSSPNDMMILHMPEVRKKRRRRKKVEDKSMPSSKRKRKKKNT